MNPNYYTLDLDGLSTNRTLSVINDNTQANGSAKKSSKPRKKHKPEGVYVNNFSQQESKNRAKHWEHVTVNSTFNIDGSENFTNENAALALISECDVTVSCLLNGLFAEAANEIKELIEPEEQIPNFQVSIGTTNELENCPGEKVDLNEVNKKNFKWYNRTPV